MAEEYMGITKSGRLEFAEAKENLTGRALALGEDGTLSLQEVPKEPPMFVALGSRGLTCTSADGLLWKPSGSLSGSPEISKIVSNSAGRFVGVGRLSNSACIYYSDDGYYWETVEAPASADVLRGIAVSSSGRFVAVGARTTLLYSDDGITWAPGSLSTGEMVHLMHVAVNATGLFVAVGSSGYTMYSSNGINWTKGSRLPSTLALQVVAVNASGRFVLIGYDVDSIATRAYYSNNGSTWTAVATSLGDSTTADIAVNASGRFVAVGQQVGYYSDNGTTWSSISLPINSYGITVSKSGKFVATGWSGSGGTGENIGVSDNGSTWSFSTQNNGTITAVCANMGI